MLKPAIKSLEGQMFLLLMVAASTAVTQLTGVDLLALGNHAINAMAGNVSPEDTLLNAAKTAKEMAEIYQASRQEVSSIKEISDMGSLGILLTFVYKIMVYFTGSRTELKKAVIEAVKEKGKEVANV